MSNTAEKARAASPNIRDQNRKRILAAATRLFARQGFDGTRMAAIAEAAELPKANVYYHFGTKLDIYLAILSELLDDWMAAMVELRADRDPIEALSAYIRTKLDHARTHPDQTRIFASEVIAGAPRIPAETRALMEDAATQQADQLQAWMDAGLLRQVDPRHLLLGIWSSTQVYGELELLAADLLGTPKLGDADYQAAQHTLEQTFLRGLRPDAPD